MSLQVFKFITPFLNLLVLGLLVGCSDSTNTRSNSGSAGLEIQLPEKTGISFQNIILETKTKNHLYYSQIYNGAGVGIGDINNDGLSDIFFCGNLVHDRLYLNEGDFVFKDISKTSGVSEINGWSWGVTMVDINSDGWLDIYVSRNGESMKNLDARRNMLYINNGDLTFTESSEKYGLADIGFSSQGVFFDMDLDGDLDLFQINQPPDPRLFLRYKIPQERQKYHTDKLYRNDGDKFYDISEQAGVNGLAYGLGVSASDFNNDGWIDLFVANDYDEPDFMYYNNKDGTFSNVIHQTLKHISRFSMGSDAADINNDGLIDLVTLDMAADDHYRSKTNMGSMSSEDFFSLVSRGKHHQYMFNTLQINSGQNTFSDVAQLAGLAKTDWSWSALMVDLNNNGQRDIVITNGIKKDLRNNDFQKSIQASINSGSRDFLGLSKKAPSQPLSNYIFKNRGDLKFENVSTDWGFDLPSYSNGMSYGDLDNDGDLDLVVNNIDSPPFIYKNKASGNFIKVKFKGPTKNLLGIGTRVTLYQNGKIQMAEHFLSRGYFSSVEPGIFFGIGQNTKADSITVDWPGGTSETFVDIEANSTLIAHYASSRNKNQQVQKNSPLIHSIDKEQDIIDFKHDENEFDDFSREILLPHKLSQNGPFMASGDVNGDGLDDIYIGGASNQPATLFFQQPDGKFFKTANQPWEKHKVSEDLGCLFFDVDQDQDLDLFVASGGSEFSNNSPFLQDRLYINDGKGNFHFEPTALPTIRESTQSVEAGDIDNDGDLDLFVGGRLIPGQYPYPASSHLLINENGSFVDQTADIAPKLEKIGLVTDAVFSDIDGDEDQDLLIVGEWMEITVFSNQNGTFTEESETFGLENTRGLWWSITAADLDNDGDDDYIVGNLGENNKFKASNEHPFRVYAHDFDDSGTNDIILASFYKDDYVPLRGRECTSQQMPYVANKFKNYHSFASSKLSDILPKDKVEQAVVYEVSNFESIILFNTGEQLVRQALPSAAQIAPLKESFITDLNKDGLPDIITVGNHYGVEVETVRYDAGIGCVLLANGEGGFNPLSSIESGFHADHDSRDIKVIEVSNKKMMIVSNNNNTLSLFTF